MSDQPTVSVWTAPYPPGFWLPTVHCARCECGWGGPDRLDHATAWADAVQHADETGHRVPDYPWEEL